jgi:hypothetical protein
LNKIRNSKSIEAYLPTTVKPQSIPFQDEYCAEQSLRSLVLVSRIPTTKSTIKHLYVLRLHTYMQQEKPCNLTFLKLAKKEKRSSHDESNSYSKEKNTN